MSIGALLIGAATEIAGAAIQNKQGDTIRKLKASRDKWRNRFIALEAAHEDALLELQMSEGRIERLRVELRSAKDSLNEVRRERDELYRRYVGSRLAAEELPDADEVYGEDEPSAPEATRNDPDMEVVDETS